MSHPKPGHVTLIGSGIMGCDIAAIFLASGARVDLVSRDPAADEQKRRRMSDALRQLGSEASAGGARFVRQVADVAWSDTELVVETVPEKLELKQAVFAEVLSLAPPAVPVVSNASGFPITRIAGHLPGAERTAGLHFFLPAHIVPVVEVVKGERTDDATVGRVYGMMKAVGRVPVRVNRDTPGFLANRIQHALMREAFAVIDEGLATPEDVDAAVRFGFGFRYVAAGPLLQKEFAGLDTQLAAARSIYPGLSRSEVPSRVLSRLVEEGRHGTKTLRGFWDWTPERIEREKARYEETLLAARKLLDVPATPEGAP